MYIDIAYTDPKTQASYEHAVLAIRAVRVEINGSDTPQVEVGLALYVGAAAMAAGAEPFETRQLSALTYAEVAALVVNFTPAMYALLLARGEWSSGTIVP